MDNSIFESIEDAEDNNKTESSDLEQKIAGKLKSTLFSSSESNTLEKRISKETNTKSSDELINGVNDKVLLDVLSPEVENNEKIKRGQKWFLLVSLIMFLGIQFFAVFYFSNKIIGYSINKTANIKIVNSLLKFDAAYITSVIVEMFAILKNIVESVFDTSITELIKLFKNNSDEDEKKEEKRKLAANKTE